MLWDIFFFSGTVFDFLRAFGLPFEAKDFKIYLPES
jgi:hypothetical protein